jgi:hypothetical protein
VSEGIDALPEVRESVRRIREYVRAHEAIDAAVMGDRVTHHPIAADVEAVSDLLAYLDSALKDPVNMLAFVKGESRTYKGSF